MNHGHALAATPQKSLSVPEDLGLPMALPVLLYSKPEGVVLSASQISTWDLCKRRWAFEYIWKLRPPPHPSAELGTKVHAVLEKWLRDATPPPEPRDKDDIVAIVAKRMIATLIKNGVKPGMGEVERRFWLRSARGICYTGFIDWSGWLMDELGHLATAVDHKTSGNIEAHGKTEADLHNDIQAVLYAMVACVGFGVDTLRLFWNYGQTKDRNPTKAVKTLVHLPVVAQKFCNVIDEEAQQLVYHRNRGTDPRTFPGNPDACGAFGGCPHKGVRCVLTPEEQLGGIMTATPSMSDRMANMLQPNQAPQGAQQFGAPPTQQYAAPPQQFATPPGGQSGPTQTYGTPPQQQFATPPQAYNQPQQAYSPTAGPNAPETSYGAPPQQQAQQQMPPQQQAQQQMPPQQQMPQQQMPQQQALPHTQAAPPAPAEEPEEKGGKGKGRPRGAKNKNKLNHEEVFMMGIQGIFSNPNFNPMSQEAAAQIEAAGELAVQAYRRRFEG